MKLSVEIDALKSAATALQEAHRDYADEHQKIVSCIDATKDYWQGIDNDKAIQAILSFEPNLKKIEDLIGMYADFLNRVADSYDQVDLMAYEYISKC